MRDLEGCYIVFKVGETKKSNQRISAPARQLERPKRPISIFSFVELLKEQLFIEDIHRCSRTPVDRTAGK